MKQFTLKFFLISYLQFIIVISAQWHFANEMQLERASHTSTLLTDGRVLVIGGQNESGSLNSCEIYNPETQIWKNTTPMNNSRVGHMAVLLNNGKVLVIGGYDYNNTRYIMGCEIFNPDTELWEKTDSLAYLKQAPLASASLLDDGRVLVVSGSICEIYDPAIGEWALGDSLNQERQFHSATKLNDGRVLVSGGVFYNMSEYLCLRSCEIFDPESNTWSVVSSMRHFRFRHSASIMNNGKIFISGGEFVYNYNQCEVYDPIKDEWIISDSLIYSRNGHKSIQLTDGDILLVGGVHHTEGIEINECEILKNNERVELADSMKYPRANHSIIQLKDGKILVTGGNYNYSNHKIYLKSCEVFEKKDTGLTEEGIASPYSWKLYGNYPNPFNPVATIEYTLPETNLVTIKVYNSIGQEVATLVNSVKQAGSHSVKFDGRNLASGVYFYRLITEGFAETKKMILLK